MNPFRLLRKIVVGLLAIVGGIVVAGGILAAIAIGSFAPDKLPVPDNAVLTLDLGEPIAERSHGGPFPFSAFGAGIALRDLVAGLDAAAGDDRVKGLIVRVGSGPLGMAYAQEIRDAVGAFRDKGKFAVAFADTFGEAGDGNTHYYLATAFEEIWMQPSGDVSLTGFAVESPYLRDTLALVGVTAELAQREEYKGIADTFTAAAMPFPIRQNLQRLTDSWLEQVAAGMAARGKFDAAAARALIDRGPFLATQAQDAKLVDRLGYWDEVDMAARERAGEGAELFPLRAYIADLPPADADAPRIAVIYGLGPVVLGADDGGSLYSDYAMNSAAVSAAIRDAVADESIRAIVFRVDSPGGSYVASDTIWREVQRAGEANKPVIVSMGEVAGSGGYFVAAPATKIVAQPGTITGSIGVAAGKFVFAGLWERLQLRWDGVKAGANADMDSLHKPFTDEGWSRLQEGLDRVYADFTQKVADGRKLDIQKVRDIAGGQVWTGADAKARGLVDELGGYAVAVRLAREAAGIDADRGVSVEEYPPPGNPLEEFIGRAMGGGLVGGADAERLAALMRVAAWLEPIVDVVGPLEGSPSALAPRLVAPVAPAGN
jgi:protease-4